MDLDAVLRQIVQHGGLVERDAAGDPVGMRIPLGEGFQVVKWERGELVVIMSDGTRPPVTLRGDDALAWAERTLGELRNLMDELRSEGLEPEPDPRLN